jgi:two-component system, NtrC family, nitrogen regulation sensor histidine kinase NtrY
MSKRLKHETRILLLALAAGFPAVTAALLFLWSSHCSAKTKWTLTVLISGFWLSCAFALVGKVRFPLQTISNLLAAIREGDYSIRARGGRRDDALGEVIIEVNALGENLREQRLAALEATALLAKVMTEIDLAVFTFDGKQKLRLVNRAGERLLGQPQERLLGRNAAELGLTDCLQGESPRTIQIMFPGGAGRWGLRRNTFRDQGAPHSLVVLSDLSRALREEERLAWQRLLRVLGHELNNSLAPIKSIAGTMEALLKREPKSPEWHQDMQRGLEIISNRTEALNRFMNAYTRLARLPQPRLASVDVGRWVQRVAGLETRLRVAIEPGPPLTIQADGDKLDHLRINLVRNAVDAALETTGSVKVSWRKNSGNLEVSVEDEGPGLSNTANLFVPFFTTKQGGSGIGLVLSRQMAEANLENRLCLMTVSLTF